jgi:diguanylate cyclase (GGDEF)-like protein
MTPTDLNPSLQGVEILIVDDSRVQATVLKNLLQANSYCVRVAGNGHEALKMAREQRPTLVISDVVMPQMNGYEMCSQLKSDAVLKDLPVILLTSLSDPEDIILGLNAQADSYLTKPYNAAFLLSTIGSTLQRLGSAPDDPNRGIEITLGAQKHTVSAGRRQMLSLLLSTYGNAVEQNRVLLQTQHELKALNEQLSDQTRRIEEQQHKLQDVNEQLQSLASHDGLTGLKNHRAFKERLDEEVRRAARETTPLALVMLDVDSFKSFNDSFGHPAGDEVLRQFAQLLREPLRMSDFVARYGGEEFAILLPNTDTEAALALAEKLRADIESAPWPQRPITASFGVSTFWMSVADHGKVNTYSGEALLEAADKALYHSKRHGRNRVSHIDDAVIAAH